MEKLIYKPLLVEDGLSRFQLATNFQEYVEAHVHELSIVDGLITIIKETALEHNISKVNRVNLRIGAMRQVVPDALRFAFEVVGKETIAEGAEIVIVDIPTRARCGDCAVEFTVEGYCFMCPSCSSSNVNVFEGKELYIDSLEGD